MTFKILSEEGKIIHWSVVRSVATEGVYRNMQADENARDTTISKDTEPHTTIQPGDVVLSKHDNVIGPDYMLPSIDVPVLLGRTFINDPNEREEQVWHKSRMQNHLRQISM